MSKKNIIGEKVGMTQLWDERGKLVPVCVVRALPNQALFQNAEGTMLGAIKRGKTPKPQQYLRDKIAKKGGLVLRWLSKEQKADSYSVRQFKVGDKVKISGVTKGKGTAGVMKRHNFSGGPMTHGSNSQRRPGSIGNQQPQRVPKGKKMAGRMGGENLTVRGLSILGIDEKRNLLMIKGPIPGIPGGIVFIQGQENG